MTCPICDSGQFEVGDVELLLYEEFWPEDGRPDHLGLKRHLEAEYDLSLTITGVKRHIDNHIKWTPAVGGGA